MMMNARNSSLTNTSVFLDFDGTISQADISLLLMDRLAGPTWRETESAYQGGVIGSLECMRREWHMLSHCTERQLRTVVKEVPLDPGFVPLVTELREAGAEVAVVSDGFGFYVEEVCRTLDLPVFTNGIDWVSREMVFPNRALDCRCPGCGTCKRTVLLGAKERGRRVVFVGDGQSDVLAAPLADLLFAKDTLAEWCTVSGTPFVPFATLLDVRDKLMSETVGR